MVVVIIVTVMFLAVLVELLTAVMDVDLESAVYKEHLGEQDVDDISADGIEAQSSVGSLEETGGRDRSCGTLEEHTAPTPRPFCAHGIVLFQGRCHA
jgi:hypothetical protein